MVYVSPAPSLFALNYYRHSKEESVFSGFNFNISEREDKEFGLYHLRISFNKTKEERKIINKFAIKNLSLKEVEKKIYYSELNSFIKKHKDYFYECLNYDVSITLNRKEIFSERIPIKDCDWNKKHFFSRLESLIN